MNVCKLGLLVLAWLASQKAHRGTQGKLAESMGPLLGSKAAWKERSETVLAATERDGHIERRGAGCTLTEKGQREVMATFRLQKLPLGWGNWKSDVVIPFMLGSPERTAAERRAGAVVRIEKLELGRAPLNAANVANALIWKAFGVDSTNAISRAGLLKAILAQRNIHDPRAGKAEVAMRLLGERHLGDPRRWLDEPTPQPAPKERAPGPETQTLDSFATRVVSAAKSSRSGRFGDNKVFISHVYRQSDPGSSLESFKDRLVEAHRAGLVRLSRADLVEAMNPDDVRSSETRYLNATFHFVRIEGGGR